MIKVVYNELIGQIPDKLISWSKLISYWGCGANLEELSPVCGLTLLNFEIFSGSVKSTNLQHCLF